MQIQRDRRQQWRKKKKRCNKTGVADLSLVGAYQQNEPSAPPGIDYDDVK